MLRRLIANSLIAMLCGVMLAPLATAWESASIPLCCRRNGKHHCMSYMSGVPGANESEPAFRAVSTCPYRSNLLLTTGVAKALTPKSVVSNLPIHPFLRIANDLVWHSYRGGLQSGRSPPLLFPKL
jgi:hypothetical protein